MNRISGSHNMKMSSLPKHWQLAVQIAAPVHTHQQGTQVSVSVYPLRPQPGMSDSLVAGL